MAMPTEHVSWSCFEAKNFLVLERFCETQQQASATLKAIDWVCGVDLQATRHCCDIELLQPRTVDLVGFFGVAAESAGLEHLQTGDGETLATAIDLARLLALVLPLGACTCIEEDGDEEEIYEAASALLVVDGRRPCCHELIDARAATNIKVLPAAVRRN